MPILVALLLVLALGFAAEAAAEKPELDLRPCTVRGTTVVGQCGRLTVPEDWNRPGARKISLYVVVLRKTGSGPEQPPLFDLQGGPGVPATDDAPLFATELKLHRVRRAVVMFDQRGTGASGPLHCPALEDASPLDDIYPRARVSACARELSAKEDLRQYTTEAAAHDIDAVRQALGYTRIDLMGLSYGTMLAQAYMKLYPRSVRSAALMGTVPLGEKLPLHHAANAELALRGIFRDCRADRSCNAAYPDLDRDWATLLRRLETQPIAGTGANRVVLRRGPFLEAVRGTVNLVTAQRRLPGAIHQAALGDFDPFLRMLPKSGSTPIPEGMYLSVTCPDTLEIHSSEIKRESAGTSFGTYRIDRQLAACRLWPAAHTSEALREPLVSSIPVLLIAGDRDSTTPLSWAKRVASRLSNSRIVEIAPLTHLPVGLSNMICMDEMMDAFYARASVSGLDTSCIASMKPPPFVVMSQGTPR